MGGAVGRLEPVADELGLFDATLGASSVIGIVARPLTVASSALTLAVRRPSASLPVETFRQVWFKAEIFSSGAATPFLASSIARAARSRRIASS